MIGCSLKLVMNHWPLKSRIQAAIHTWKTLRQGRRSLALRPAGVHICMGVRLHAGTAECVLYARGG